MNYAKITYPDLNNGTGCRVTLWFCGCTHRCLGCHNQQLWNFNYGKEFTLKTYNILKEVLELPYINGITMSGGEPAQQEDIVELCHKIKQDFPNKDIWFYTGYTFDQLKDKLPRIMQYLDVLVTGKFEIQNKDLTLPFRGSSNQRIYKKLMNSSIWSLSIGDY